MNRAIAVGICFFLALSSENGQATGAGSETTIHVVTDLLDGQIGLRGGTLMELRLREHPVLLGQKDKPFALMEQKRGNVFAAQSGLLGRGDAPTHHAQYVAEAQDYALEDGEDTLEVPLMWEGEQVTVTKTYRFRRGSYLIEVFHEVENKGEVTWSGRMYGQFLRTAPTESDSIYTYTGGVLSSPETPYEKIHFDDMESQDLRRNIRAAGSP